MTDVHKSRAASIDLDHVWSYIAADNPDAADTFLRRILARCQLYAHQPRLGESRPDLGREVRCFSVERYVVSMHPKPRAVNTALAYYP